MINIIDISIEFIINKIFDRFADKASSYYKHELKDCICKYSEKYFNNTYKHLLMSEEFDFFELNRYIYQTINKDALVRFISTPYTQKHKTLGCFLENAYIRAHADTPIKKKTVENYLITLLDIIQKFFISKAELSEAILSNYSIEQTANLINDLKVDIQNIISKPILSETFYDFIESISPPRCVNNPFHYLNKSIGFYGRDSELESIEKFLNDTRQILLSIIVGNAGIGKSKLMKEFIDLHNNDFSWKMLLFSPPMAKMLFRFKSYSYDKNLLIVIDYARLLSKEIGDWLYSLSGLRQESQPQKVRIILLDREAHLGSLDDWTTSLFGMPCTSRFELLNDFLYDWSNGKSKYILKLDQPVLDSMMSMAQDYATSIGKTLKEEDRNQITNYLMNLNNQSKVSPLFVLLATDNYLTNNMISSWNMDNILFTIVNKYKKQWMDLCDNDIDMHNAISELMVYSTINGQFDIFTDDVPDLINSSKKYISNKTTFTQFKNMISAINEMDEFDRIVHPLEPDIIGEAFVVQFIYEHWHNKDYISSIISNREMSAHFFSQCLLDFDSDSQYYTVIDDDSYIWAILAPKWDMAKLMLDETDFIIKLKYMNLFSKSLKLYFNNFVICRSEMIRIFWDTATKRCSEFSIESQNFIHKHFKKLNANFMFTASLVMDCKRNNRDSKESSSYLNEGVQYLKKQGFPDSFCSICGNADIHIVKTKCLESQIIEVFSLFCEYVLSQFNSNPDSIFSALYHINEIYILDNDHDNFIIRLFNEFLLLKEVYDCSECDNIFNENDINSFEEKELEDKTIYFKSQKEKYNYLLMRSADYRKFGLTRYYCNKLWTNIETSDKIIC